MFPGNKYQYLTRNNDRDYNISGWIQTARGHVSFYVRVCHSARILMATEPHDPSTGYEVVIGQYLS